MKKRGEECGRRDEDVRGGGGERSSNHSQTIPNVLYVHKYSKVMTPPRATSYLAVLYKV